MSIGIKDDTTIVSLVEERLVMGKQLYLREKVQRRHFATQELSWTSVQLRRQVAVIERFDADRVTVRDDLSLHSDTFSIRNADPQGSTIMGILENVIGGLLGGAAGGASSPMGSILSSMLGGGQQMGGGLSGNMGGGGLGGLLQQFQNAGLGHVAQSWVGNGPNQSVSTDQLQNVFGQDRINDMANQAGMQPGDFLSQLSQHLPNAVNGMTPNGSLPNEGSMSV